MIGDEIKNYLSEKGIKQAFLVEKTKLSPSQVSDICNNDRKLDCVEYYKICKALDLPLNYFLDRIMSGDKQNLERRQS